MYIHRTYQPISTMSDITLLTNEIMSLNSDVDGLIEGLNKLNKAYSTVKQIKQKYHETMKEKPDKEKLDEKLDKKLDEKLDEKLSELLDEKLSEQLDKKLGEVLEKKIYELWSEAFESAYHAIEDEVREEFLYNRDL